MTASTCRPSHLIWNKFNSSKIPMTGKPSLFMEKVEWILFVETWNAQSKSMKQNESRKWKIDLNLTLQHSCSSKRPGVNFTNILRAAFFVQKVHVKFCCAFILGVSFLGTIILVQMRSWNVGEIEHRGQFYQPIGSKAQMLRHKKVSTILFHQPSCAELY